MIDFTSLIFSIFGYGFYVSPVLAIIWVILENRRVPKGQVSEEPFSIWAKIAIAILCGLLPIITGPIFYYSLRKKFPRKARYANWASIILFVVELAAIFYFFHLPLTGYVQPN